MSKKVISTQLKYAGLAAAIAVLSAPAHATVTSYSQDFEGLLVGDPNNDPGPDDAELANDGWLVGANVYDGVGTYPGGFKFFYGLFAAPNGGPAFSSVATGDATNGGVGVNYMNVYSDYNCCDLGTAAPQGHGDDNTDANGAFDVVNGLVLREYNITSDDIGKSVTFTFDAKRPDFVDDGFGGDNSAAVGNGCSEPCTANAFVKTLDPNAGYSTTNLLTEDMTTISQSAWGTYSITLDLTDAALDGQILQVGFESFAGQFNNTGVYYDNISLDVTGGGEAVPLPGFALAAIGGLLTLIGAGAMRKRVA